MTSWPVKDPAVAGSNCTSRVNDCPGLSVDGNELPESEKPAPLTEAELIVTGAVPVELSVIGCTTGVLTMTVPNPIDVAFTVRVAEDALSCSETVLDVLPEVAVRIADCAVLTAAALATKDAVVAAAGTVREPGTVTELLLLARLTMRPPVGAALDRLTVQESATEPVMEVSLQEIALTVGVTAAPAPLMLIVAVGALLVMVTMPV
jgi:hypothetical protein